MPKPSIFWAVPVVAMLSGCAIAAKVNARHDMETSKVAYQACLVENTQNVAACDGWRSAYEADLYAYQATAAATRPGPVYNQEPAPTPDFGAGSIGQQVYSSNECIGPIVMGVCHGAILPHSATHPTCYGQMLNGMCTGPMF